MKKQIRKWIPITLIAAGICGFQACSKKSDSLPSIGGYNSSDDVAAANLVAYFPFDGNSNDTKGNETGTATNVTYVTGMRGQAYQGAANAYATVTPSAAFSSLPSYSLSMWYRLSAQPTAGDPQGLFFLSGTNTQNELIYEIDTPSGTQAGTDSLKLHQGFTNLGSPGYQGFTMEAYDTTKYGSHWIHVVTTYDATTSKYIVYQDGMETKNGSAFGKNLETILLQSNDPGAAPQGALSWSTDPPTQIIIGTWPAGLYGVSPTLGSNGCFKGQLDELRIFNTALKGTDVGALYQLGLAGR